MKSLKRRMKIEKMDEKEAGGIVLGIIFALAMTIIISRQLFLFFLD